MYGDMKMMVFREEYSYNGGQVNLACNLRRIRHTDHIALGGSKNW